MSDAEKTAFELAYWNIPSVATYVEMCMNYNQPIDNRMVLRYVVESHIDLERRFSDYMCCNIKLPPIYITQSQADAFLPE